MSTEDPERKSVPAPIGVTETLRATGAVLGLLPQVAGFVVGTSALSFVIGYRQASAYYLEIGASWALPLQTSFQFMLTGLWATTVLAFTLLVSVFLLTQGQITDRGLRRFAIFVGFLGLVSIGFSIYLEGADRHQAELATAFLFAFAAGVALGELVANLAKGNYQWGSGEVFLLYFIILYALSWAPQGMGKARASIDGVPEATELPVASLKDEVADDWRVVAALDGNFLLMKPSLKRADREFRLVSPATVLSIRKRGEIAEKQKER